jgi:hypothetical protein
MEWKSGFSRYLCIVFATIAQFMAICGPVGIINTDRPDCGYCVVTETAISLYSARTMGQSGR